ncbi:MAG: hypothetical protein H7326_01860 [Bdellovibrionaceae bacterium]|nr:hypothetical protein [Pseudobdellovibrionaceae bacterium]
MTKSDTIAKSTLGAFMFIILMLALNSWSQTTQPAGVNSDSFTGWMLSKPEWSPGDEANYQKYVAYVGEGVSKGLCNTVSSCFRNPKVNPYASTDPGGLKLYSDCADFPYFVRGYYAWRFQLPFGFITEVAAIESPEGSRDIRYSPYGNIVTKRYDVIPTKSGNSVKYPNALQILNSSIQGNITSANFRVSYSGMDGDGLFSDFYPARINREAIRPGTVIYDPNGHVVTVYKITKDGRVYYIDAHPDNSLTTGLFNSRFIRSYPGQGAGFKNWRPIKLVGGEYSSTQGYYGGHLVAAKDNELPLFSTEQYFGTNKSQDWKAAQYVFNGQTMKYHDWVRNRLADGPLVENPVDDVRVMAQELCNGLEERADAVQVAVTAGIHNQAHPLTLPKNIYGADGDWETYATPARDARMRVAFKELRDYVEAALQHYRSQDGVVDYNGKNLAADMSAAYKERSNACKINYKNSAGRTVTLSLEDARARLYAISFDPYHCPELRWGASGQELASCQSDANKRQWYDAEKWLRFQHERNTDAFMGYTLEDLNGPKPGAGVEAGQDLDILAFLGKNQ